MDEKSHQLPSTIVAKEFGEVNVQHKKDGIKVLFTILMEPTGKDAEGWRTGVALDASVSMKWAYGKKLEGTIPDEVKAEYDKKGWLKSQKTDDLAVKYVKKEAVNDAIDKGYLKYGENIIQKLARDFTSYLASILDAKGKVAVVYWACGDGDQYEPLGEFSHKKCQKLKLTGPKKHSFGSNTKLLPVLRYFADKFSEEKQSMAIFLTDGHLEDFEEVKEYTIEMAQNVATGKQNFIKCVLIGVGNEVSREQLEELDDLETGTDVDVWDHKIAHEMRSLVEIFAEVVNEHQIVAPMATLYDAHGEIIKKFSDGLPAIVTFQMPISSTFFDLVVGEYRIRQTVEIP